VSLCDFALFADSRTPPPDDIPFTQDDDSGGIIVMRFGGYHYVDNILRGIAEYPKIVLSPGVTVRNKTFSAAGVTHGIDSIARAGMWTADEPGEYAWLGDVTAESHGWLYLRAAHPEAVLTLGEPDGTNAIKSVGEHVFHRRMDTVFLGPGKFVVNSRMDIKPWPETGAMTTFGDGATVGIWSKSNKVETAALRDAVLRVHTGDAFEPPPILHIGCLDKDSRATLDLNGHRLTLAGLREDNVGEGGTRRIISATPATLVFSNTITCIIAQTNTFVTGPLSVEKNGSGALVLGRRLDISGGVRINAGTLVIEARSGFGNSATNITVAAGAVVEVGDNAAFPADTALALETGAEFNIPRGVNLTVATLSIDGKPQFSGVYGSAESNARGKHKIFTGSGTLTARRSELLGFTIAN